MQSGTRQFFSRNARRLMWNESTGGGNRKRHLIVFQMGPRNDLVAVWRVAKSRSWWDVSDGSQHVKSSWMALGEQSLCAQGGTIYSRPVAWLATSATPSCIIAIWWRSHVPAMGRARTQGAFVGAFQLIGGYIKMITKLELAPETTYISRLLKCS